MYKRKKKKKKSKYTYFTNIMNSFSKFSLLIRKIMKSGEIPPGYHYRNPFPAILRI